MWWWWSRGQNSCPLTEKSGVQIAIESNIVIMNTLCSNLFDVNAIRKVIKLRKRWFYSPRQKNASISIIWKHLQKNITPIEASIRSRKLPRDLFTSATQRCCQCTDFRHSCDLIPRWRVSEKPFSALTWQLTAKQLSSSTFPLLRWQQKVVQTRYQRMETNKLIFNSRNTFYD